MSKGSQIYADTASISPAIHNEDSFLIFVFNQFDSEEPSYSFLCTYPLGVYWNSWACKFMFLRKFGNLVTILLAPGHKSWCDFSGLTTGKLQTLANRCHGGSCSSHTILGVEPVLYGFQREVQLRTPGSCLIGHTLCIFELLVLEAFIPRSLYWVPGQRSFFGAPAEVFF